MILEAYCAGLSDELATSQLFGHRRGSFTGADRDAKGLFEAASGGATVAMAVFSKVTNTQIPANMISEAPATAGTEIEATRHLQYGTALVLIILVLGLNLFALIYRARLRKRR